jgi:hypothetical protein
MLLPIWLPLLLAIRSAAHWSLAQMAWGFFIPLALSPLVSIAALIFVMESSRLISPERLRLFFVVVSAVAAVSIVFLIRLIQPEKLADPASAVSAAQILKNWSMPEPWWNPAKAATDAVLDFDLLSALGLFSAAFLATVTGLGLYAPRFYSHWQRLHSMGEGRSADKGKSQFWRLVKGPRLALAAKEFSAVARNNSQRLQMLFVASLTGIFLYNLRRLPLQDDPSMAQMLFLPACGFSQMILIAVATRFVFPAESSEASGSWILRSAPLPRRTYLLSRLAIYTPFLLLLNAVLLWACVRAFHPGLPQCLAAAALGFFSPLGVTAITAWLGLAWKSPSNTQPEELATSPAAVLVMALCLGYVLAELALLELPLYEYHRVHLMLWLKPNLLLMAVSAGLWIFLQSLALGQPWRMAWRRMEEGA